MTFCFGGGRGAKELATATIEMQRKMMDFILSLSITFLSIYDFYILNSLVPKKDKLCAINKSVKICTVVKTSDILRKMR
jgi:hypothetical protein